MNTPASPWPDYNPAEIEPHWQNQWQAERLFLASETSDRPKYYCLDFYPYPSGEGLHVGHCRNYVPTDVLSRYMRMRGFNVLHPMGWDAFGEPAEQHAVRMGVHPRQTTDRNTANYKRQMNLIGASYDWSREIDSSKPEYYRWTQYFFLLLYQRGLAYRDTSWQWWCPTCQTTLSSHEAAGGVCWRGHTGLTRREIPAWYFRITAYADELADALDTVDWPEKIKAMQRNWIGRSQGAEIDFVLANSPAENHAERIPVFTTRPDTLFGATFFLLAPEHPLALRLAGPGELPAVQAYIEQAVRRGEVERMAESRLKTGVFTGSYVLNPLSGEPLPVWVADYVLPGYGTGAVMGVPAHDQRDFDFATQYNLPVRVVVARPGVDLSSERLQQAVEAHGVLVNSGGYTGMDSESAIQQITADLQAAGRGRPAVQYRMRDWLISRQRYWGAPIPVIHCPACGIVPVPVNELPVLLPEMQDFTPDGSGRSPLNRLPEFVHTACPQCGGPAERETDTMGGFACSSWYFLRFASPHYDQGPFDPEALRYWLPVDLYVGGAEHAVLHLLYARFWIKVMADAGLVSFREPFSKLINQGQMMGVDGQRMSKSRGNVIVPDQVVASHGADALRLYELFMAPFEQDVNWSTEGLQGTRRFVNRVWALIGETYGRSSSTGAEDIELRRLLHRTIKAVGERIQGFRFNTMVSALMEFTNALAERQRAGAWKNADFQNSLDTLLVLLAPAAPFIAEELWRLTGHSTSIHQQPWPDYDPELAKDEQLRVAVQVDGKVRAVIEASMQASENELQALALSDPKVQAFLAGRVLQRTVYVPGKIFSIVTKETDPRKYTTAR